MPFSFSVVLSGSLTTLTDIYIFITQTYITLENTNSLTTINMLSIRHKNLNYHQV